MSKIKTTSVSRRASHARFNRSVGATDTTSVAPPESLNCGCACGCPPRARRAWTISLFANIVEAGEWRGPLATTITHSSVGEVVGEKIRWGSLSESVTAERDPNFIDDRLDTPIALGPRRAVLPECAVLDRVTLECPACGVSRELLDDRTVVDAGRHQSVDRKQSKHRHAPRGGHYPGHLRDEFIEALEEYLAGRANDPSRLVAACGTVWSCTDVVPNDYFEWAKDIRGVEVKSRTYAALARGIRGALSNAAPVRAARRRVALARSGAARGAA